MKINIGVVGCGHISGIYLQNLRRFEHLAVLACADLDPARAAARAQVYGVPRACSVQELIDDADIHLVVNLTVPQAHVQEAM